MQYSRMWRGLVLAALIAGTACSAGCQRNVAVLTYNIHHAAGADGRVDLERIAAVIRAARADLVALQEVDRGVRRSGGEDQPQRLAELTGMHVAFAKNIALQGGEYGNAVLSRFPIERYENHALPRLDDSEQRGALEVHVRIGGRPVVFVATHLDHCANDRERRASLATLRELVERNADRTVIVAGDFNARPDSAVLSDATAFLRDACAAVGHTDLTYPAGKPSERIDYVLVLPRAGLGCVACQVLPEAVASDHRPVLATLTLGGP